MPTEPDPRDFPTQGGYIRALKAAGIARRETRSRLDWKLANNREPTLNELTQNSKYVSRRYPKTPINVSYPAAITVHNQQGRQKEIIYQEETIVTTKIKFGTLPKGELIPFLQKDYEERKQNVLRSLAQSRGRAGRILGLTGYRGNRGGGRGFGGPKGRTTSRPSAFASRYGFQDDAYTYGLS